VLDEHDRNRAGVLRVAGGIVFPADLRPDEVLDRTGVRVPEGDVYDTVGGFVMSVLERIPVVGDTVEIEDGTLTVQRMDGRRVDRVLFEPTPVPDTATTASAVEPMRRAPRREDGDRR